jgi:hypothetical protein
MRATRPFIPATLNPTNLRIKRACAQVAAKHVKHETSAKRAWKF